MTDTPETCERCGQQLPDGQDSLRCTGTASAIQDHMPRRGPDSESWFAQHKVEIISIIVAAVVLVLGWSGVVDWGPILAVGCFLFFVVWLGALSAKVAIWPFKK